MKRDTFANTHKHTHTVDNVVKSQNISKIMINVASPTFYFSNILHVLWINLMTNAHWIIHFKLGHWQHQLKASNSQWEHTSKLFFFSAYVIEFIEWKINIFTLYTLYTKWIDLIRILLHIWWMVESCCVSFILR